MKRIDILSQMFLNSEGMQKIWLVKIDENEAVFTKEKLLEHLPKSLQSKAMRYLDTESAMSYIIGRLLLKNALVINGFSASLLEDISYSEHGKPYLKGLNFSISHSNGYVILIFGTESSVGIDIEKKRNIDLKLFEYLFTGQEWKSILTANNSTERFYWYWVRKEALLKAAGCTLKALKQLEIYEHHGIYKGKRYFFDSFDFNTEFNGVLATEIKEKFDLEMMNLEDLIAD